MRKILLMASLLWTANVFSQTALKIKFEIPEGVSARISESSKPKFNKVSALKFVKQEEEDSYQGVLTDVNDDALATFIIEQSNRALFYDKLSEAVKELAIDIASDDLKAIVDHYRGLEPDLYTRFLEGKEGLANTTNLAGILTIRKKTKVHNDSLKEMKLKSLTFMGIRFYSSFQNARVNIDNALVRVNKIAEDAQNQLKDTVAKKAADSVKIKMAQEQANHLILIAGQIQDKVGNSIKYANQLIKNNLPDTGNARLRMMNNYKNAIAELNKAAKLANSIAKGQEMMVKAVEPISDYLDGNFTIHNLQIQFQDGFIENMKVFGKMEGNNEMLRFENQYPIAFSTRKNIKRLIDKDLYERSNYRKYDTLRLKVGEFLSYNYDLSINNKDYSPANQVLTVKNITTSTKEISLYKEQTSKILEARIFSDLKGADNSNPNGLIQVEVSKRLNFLSNRFNFIKGKSNSTWLNIGNYGWLNFLTPQFSINKIEENNKQFILNRIDTLSLAADTSSALTYASSINLLKHQIYKVGFDLSVFILDIPGIKSTINIGTGIHFGRTAIQDTVRTKIKYTDTFFQFKPTEGIKPFQYGINTFQWGPYITWQIFPDSRFGVSATQRFTWFKALTDKFVQVRDSVHFQKFAATTDRNAVLTTPYSYYSKGIFSKCLASSEIFAYLNASDDGNNKLFFRYRLNWDLLNSKENFHQMQIGFSTTINATKEYKKLKKSYEDGSSSTSTNTSNQ